MQLLQYFEAALKMFHHTLRCIKKKFLEHVYEQEILDYQRKEETRNVEDQSQNQRGRTSNFSQTEKSVEEDQEEALSMKLHSGGDENHGVNEPKQQFSKQVVQPYVLPLKKENVSEDTLSLDNLSRSTRNDESAANETVTVKYIPAQEIIVKDPSATAKYPPQENGFNDLSQIISQENVDIESTGEFGQRVRSAPAFRQKTNENFPRFRPKQITDASSSSEDYRKHYRKSFRSHVSKKLNISESNLSVFAKDRPPFALTRTTEPQRGLKQGEIEGDYTDNPSTVKDTFSSTSAPIVSVSLGKFSGPIVVPDLPQQKKYSYITIADHSEDSEKKPIGTQAEVAKKTSENSYPAASSVVLNPLQVGVALMNAGQDINLVNDQVTSAKYPQGEADTSHATVIDNESLIQSDAPESRNSSFQDDQVSQQEQIYEVVATNLPSQTVEIQKSVEVFHTAPVHEIHYPVEFVPHAQPLTKQRLQEDYRKPTRSQFKDQKSNQVNVYRSNEISDENNLNSQKRNPYDYNVNENDVTYSTSSSQAEQTLPVARPIETKPIVEVKDQVNSAQYDQTVLKHPRVQEIPEASIKQSYYELSKGSTSNIAQPPRGIDSLPGLTNLENLQGTQEVPQMLVTKVINEPPTEVRFLMSVPPSYSVEKTIHAPHPVEVVEKKMPFPVEKLIEKQITIPQPFPVHVPIDKIIEKQVRIPYPVHVEKVVEKKVPFAIQRFIIPLPIHFRIPQPIPIPVEKVVGKPVPVPVEKVVHLPRPYTVEIEKSRPYSIENTKLIKSGPIYNIQSDDNYQQGIRPNFQIPLEPLYGSDNEQNYYNSTAQFYETGYLALNRPPTRQPSIHTLPKKFGSYGIQHPHSITYTVNNGNLVSYGRTSEKDKIKDEYVGPVPRKVQVSLGVQSKSLYSSPNAQATLRRTRQEAVGNTGSFRQSKMEYGFKPPMVPSVQYDEQTATKVE
ncbi:hypothetical protein WN48_01252 [Eufriesea mexicana]|uniref:Zinc finger protein 512B n=1 Tax=Eufriesea mexicana TaxID=516756 RepID=A0A310SE11_9HYME|nr:hypothetical protein WN48_01252 [Eufriesea mexicana]